MEGVRKLTLLLLLLLQPTLDPCKVFQVTGLARTMPAGTVVQMTCSLGPLCDEVTCTITPPGWVWWKPYSGILVWGIAPGAYFNWVTFGANPDTGYQVPWVKGIEMYGVSVWGAAEARKTQNISLHFPGLAGLPIYWRAGILVNGKWVGSGEWTAKVTLR